MSTAVLRGLRGLRGIRLLRLLRIVRILKISRFSLILEDVCFYFGQSWLSIASTIIRCLVSMFLVAHVGGCVWYLIGRMSLDGGSQSWLTYIDAGLASNRGDTYSMSLHYTLAHLAAAPVDGKVGPQNVLERVFSMFAIFTSLLILGTAISQISQTVQDIQKSESAKADVRRELRQYFKTTDTPVEISTRALHFVEGTFKKRRAAVLSESISDLLSESLLAELALTTHSKHIIGHPLFEILFEQFDDVYLAICIALGCTDYAPNDVVFKAGTRSAGLYIMVHGAYFLEGKQNRRFGVADNPSWFSEVSLFAQTLHKSKLVCKSF